MINNLLKKIFPANSQTDSKVENVELADKLIGEGNQHEDAGKVDLAEALYRQALTIHPGYAKAHLNLGILLAEKGDIKGAADAYETALAIDRHNPFVNYNYARLLLRQRDLAKAEILLREAVRAKPDFSQAFIYLATVLDATGQKSFAMEALDTALRLNPNDVGVWLSRANLLRQLGRLDEAETAIERVLALDPGNSHALRLHSLVLRGHGLASEALARLREAIAIDPGSLEYQSEELLLMSFLEEVDGAQLFRRHAEVGARLEAAHPVRFQHFIGTNDPNRRLRIGYVSGDFCIHPVSLFLIPLLEKRSHKDFEIYLYSSGTVSDHITKKIEGLADHWTDAQNLSVDELANEIHADAIDILIDLTGHTSQSKLATFCKRPAPVQAIWLGYLNTSGLTHIDYRICDDRTDPLELSQPLHTEKLIQLPNSQWCYRPFFEAKPAKLSPFEKNNFVTFGSFNDAPKISVTMCRRWMQLLSRVPDSRLIIAGVNSERKRNAIRMEMTRAGVSSDRVEFKPRVELDEYLEFFAEVDISLDTFPYGGGTTTFDSLWMGVPVVTATGSTSVSRSASSILKLIGLDDWIAPTVDAYMDLAEQRAMDRSALAELRRALPTLVRNSPLTDEAAYVRDFEAALRSMWVTHTGMA